MVPVLLATPARMCPCVFLHQRHGTASSESPRTRATPTPKGHEEKNGIHHRPQRKHQEGHRETKSRALDQQTRAQANRAQGAEQRRRHSHPGWRNTKLATKLPIWELHLDGTNLLQHTIDSRPRGKGRSMHSA